MIFFRHIEFFQKLCFFQIECPPVFQKKKNLGDLPPSFCCRASILEVSQRTPCPFQTWKNWKHQTHESKQIMAVSNLNIRGAKKNTFFCGIFQSQLCENLTGRHKIGHGAFPNLSPEAGTGTRPPEDNVPVRWPPRSCPVTSKKTRNLRPT